MKMRIVPVFLLLTVFVSLLWADKGICGGVVIATPNGESISSVLPDGWHSFSEAELDGILGKSMSSENGDVLGGFFDSGQNGSNAVIFVFRSMPDMEVPKQQRQKMLSWFTRNREILAKMLPASASDMSLEDLEYDPARQRILFETKMSIDNQELYGKTAIIFLKKGYLNVVGYEGAGDLRLTPVFDAFVDKISLPSSMAPEQQYVYLPSMIRQHWQKISGVVIILAVYGFVFLRREKSLG